MYGGGGDSITMSLEILNILIGVTMEQKEHEESVKKEQNKQWMMTSILFFVVMFLFSECYFLSAGWFVLLLDQFWNRHLEKQKRSGKVVAGGKLIHWGLIVVFGILFVIEVVLWRRK